MDLTISAPRFPPPVSTEVQTADRWPVETTFQILPARPRLEDVLEEIGPLPSGALFLGQAEDSLPVLLNLHDPAPGPLLIYGCSGSGKTDLLRVTAQFAISTYTAGQVQFAVITDHPEEWQDRLINAPHCAGLFSNEEPATSQLLQSLAMWISRAGGRQQSVLLLIDGLEHILSGDSATEDCLRQILTCGPGKRVWPLVTAQPHAEQRLQEWMPLFRLQIGALLDRETARQAGRPWFCFQKNGKRIHFWVPASGF